jgi:hypothetical protein
MNKNFLIISVALLAVYCTSPKTDSLPSGRVFLDTTVTNLGSSIRLTVISDSDTTALLKSTSGEVEAIIDTLDQPQALGYIEVIDFDKNGSSDILLDYIGNNPTYFLYLYDSKTSAFKNIDDYKGFPEGQQLDSNSQLYYSYHRAGCADLNWVSDLFAIKNFKITHLAHIYAEGCEDEQQGISVFKIIGNNSDRTTLIETIPYSDEQNDSKWDIIKKYWNENYIKFLEGAK